VTGTRAKHVPSADHLKGHQFQVEGEPLSANPLSVRLYAADDAVVRAMKDRGLFIREAVRLHLKHSQQGSQQDSQ
jgi:hypothetical protein